MNIDQFEVIVDNLWNKPDLIPTLKSLLGTDWEKKAQSLMSELDKELKWMAAHELGLSGHFTKVAGPTFPFLRPDDVGERSASLALNANYNYTRMLLDTFELIPYWENERNLNIDADILVAWEVPDSDPDSRFNEFPEYMGWKLEVRLVTPSEAQALVGNLILGQNPIGTIYLNPLPMIKEKNVTSLRDMALDLIVQLGDPGDGLGD